MVVDDGSTDQTWEVLQTLPVHALRHPVNLGQGAALQTGMDYALHCGAEMVVHFDADGQHVAEQIINLLRPIRLGQADAVFGSRFLREADRNLVPRTKRLVLRAGSLISGLLTGVWLRDSHNGFRALSRKSLHQILLHENGYAHATEILGQVRRTGFGYLEVPATVRYSDYSISKGQSLLNGFNIVFDLVLGRLFR